MRLPGASVIALGADVYNGTLGVLSPTVRANSTLAPTESSTKTVALPTAPLLMLKLVPVTDAVATPALLLLAAYGGTPPPMVKLVVADPLDMVIALGAEVYKVGVDADPMVTPITTCVPVASNTKTCAVPAVPPPIIVKVVPAIPAVATPVLLLLAA